ncbi:BrnA antitoxin family protein [Aurantimonas sp. A2-1-M11]|uniref:BrnA antitoxin family protein n=1 Tax=Aurantimonas sp. A2-1-M11 TaxID=3113712 RepID=UPI002F95EE1D
MKKRYETEISPADLAELPDDAIGTSDIPELDDAFWENAVLVEPNLTQPVTLRVKKSVLEAFKAEGKGYQTRMNAVLESYARTLKNGR